MGYYWVPQGLHLVPSLFACGCCFSVSQGGTGRVLQGNVPRCSLSSCVYSLRHMTGQLWGHFAGGWVHRRERSSSTSADELEWANYKMFVLEKVPENGYLRCYYLTTRNKSFKTSLAQRLVHKGRGDGDKKKMFFPAL